MLKLKKNTEVQTKYPGIIYIIRATPDDSIDFNGITKNFYIVDVIDRNKKDGRVYSITPKTFDATELREAFGMKRNEILRIF